MGKRGPKPKGKVEIKWSANFAYAIGLIVSDGSLSKDGRHIIFTSKDVDQLKTFKKCLGIESVKIGNQNRGMYSYPSRVQITDVIFYTFLLDIGLMPNKSKIIGKVKVPDEYFYDFLRGSFDGDGCFYSYWDPRWKSSHMFYLTFSSASLKHVEWLRGEVKERLSISGHISKSKSNGSIYNLRFAKKDSMVIIDKMYYNPSVLSLRRKRLKIKKVIAVEKIQQFKYKK
jgi:hypothetical protein